MNDQRMYTAQEVADLLNAQAVGNPAPPSDGLYQPDEMGNFHCNPEDPHCQQAMLNFQFHQQPAVGAGPQGGPMTVPMGHRRRAAGVMTAPFPLHGLVIHRRLPHLSIPPPPNYTVSKTFSGGGGFAPAHGPINQ